MRNIEMSVSGDKLTITVDISKRLGDSKSGKTEIIASTDGNVNIPESDKIKIGLNIYSKKGNENG